MHELAIPQQKPRRVQVRSPGLLDLEELSGSCPSAVLPGPKHPLFEAPLNKDTPGYSERQAAVSHRTDQTRSAAGLLEPDRQTRAGEKSGVAPGCLCSLPQHSSSTGLTKWRPWITDTPPEVRTVLTSFPRQHSLRPSLQRQGMKYLLLEILCDLARGHLTAPGSLAVSFCCHGTDTRDVS